MTTTLLKHEWLRTRGLLGTSFGVILLVGILGSMLGALDFSVVSMFGVFLGVLAAVAIVPVIQLLLAMDYWRTGYGRTGYFTQSIPVRGSTIFWAKLLWAVLVSLVALVFALLLGWLAWWAVAVTSGSELPSPAVLGDAMQSLASFAPAWLIVAAILGVVVSVATMTIYYYFSVSLGHERWLASLGAGGPIVVFVVLYIVTQVTTFLGMLLVPLGLGVENDRLAVVPFNVVSEMSMGAESSSVMPIGFVATTVVLLALLLWRTARSWNHKVALR